MKKVMISRIILAIGMMLIWGIYGVTLFVASSNCNAASYPQNTATPLATDLSMNQYKLYDMSDVITKGPWVDVRAFGAVGNGSTDDTLAIQAALDAGGSILFPEGYYKITNELIINKEITIRGYGMNSQIYQASTNKSNFVITKNGGHVNGVDIRGLYLLSASTTSGTALLKMTRVHRSKIDIMMYGGYWGIYLEGSLANEIRAISGVNLGATIGPGWFPSTAQYGIYSTRDIANSISSNANTFINPVIEGEVNGMFIEDGAGEGNSYIIGGTIEAHSGHGLYIKNCTMPITVLGTHFEANGSAGGAKYDVLIENSSDVSLNGIYAWSVISDGASVRLAGTTKSTNITDSRINTLIIDSTCESTFIEGGKVAAFKDYSTTTRGFTYSDTSDVMWGRSPHAIVDVCKNGHMEDWVGSVPPLFREINGATLTKTGTGQADTIRHSPNYAVKVTGGGSSYSGMAYPLPTIRYSNIWISIDCWVRQDSGSSPATIGLWDTAGNWLLTNTYSQTTLGSWERVQATFLHTGIYDYAVFLVPNGITAYFDDIRILYEDTGVITGVRTLSVNNGTPVVTSQGENHSVFKTANTIATTLTNLVDGFVGQIVTIIIGDAVTKVDFTGTPLKGNGNRDWTPANGDWMECTFDGTNWYCDTTTGLQIGEVTGINTGTTGIKSGAVTFGTAYPSGITPTIMLTLKDPSSTTLRFDDCYITSASNTGFTYNVVVRTAAGGSTVKLQWVSQP